MGLFRKHKASRHTADSCKQGERDAIRRLIITVGGDDAVTDHRALESQLTQWAQWRECRARIEGENETKEDTR